MSTANPQRDSSSLRSLTAPSRPAPLSVSERRIRVGTISSRSVSSDSQPMSAAVSSRNNKNKNKRFINDYLKIYYVKKHFTHHYFTI